MPEDDGHGGVIITPKDLWDKLQSMDKRIARIERFVYTVTGGGIIIGAILGWLGNYAANHVG